MLAWVACVPLLVGVIAEREVVRAFLAAELCGAVLLAGSCYWFVDVMERFGGIPVPAAVALMLPFLAVFAIPFGAFGAIECVVARRSTAIALGLCPFLWVAMELARDYYVSGFPWNLLGYAVHANGLKRLAAYTGVYGLSFLAAAISALVAWMLLGPRRKRAAVALVFGILGLGLWNWAAAPPERKPGKAVASLVQPNIPLDDTKLREWAPWINPAPLDRLVASTSASVEKRGEALAPPPLIVWPENPAPFYYDRDPIFHVAMVKLALESRAWMVVSTVTFAGGNSAMPRNSAVVLAPDGRAVLQYDKIHLVPFGEYVPPWGFPGLVKKLTLEAGDFVPGSKYEAARTPQGALTIFICYEAIFPELVRRLTPPGPAVLVNVSNDAWYGDSPAAAQHFQMARLRAVENGRYLLRATNDGITAIVDPYGRVVDKLPRHTSQVLTGRFDYLAGETFYTAYGDVFAWLCVAVAVALLAWAVFKREERRAETHS